MDIKAIMSVRGLVILNELMLELHLDIHAPQAHELKPKGKKIPESFSVALIEHC